MLVVVINKLQKLQEELLAGGLVPGSLRESSRLFSYRLPAASFSYSIGYFSFPYFRYIMSTVGQKGTYQDGERILSIQSHVVSGYVGEYDHLLS